MAALIQLLIIILLCIVRTLQQSTQKLVTELHLAVLNNKKKKKRARCWEPAREITPMIKFLQRRPDRQRWIRTRGIPSTCLSICPKTKICLSTVYYTIPFTNSPDINRGLSPTTFFFFFFEENQLKALVNKSPDLVRIILILTPVLLF